MSRRLVLFTVVLITALLCLLLLLIFWAKRSAELREALFHDQVEISLTDWAVELEEDYYCFDLKAEFDLPKMDTFFISEFPGFTHPEGKHTKLYYVTPDGEQGSFTEMPLIAPAHLQMFLRFEFKNSAPNVATDSLSEFEQVIHKWYDQYILDSNGIRLIDTTQFDSLLHARIASINPEAEIAYEVRYRQNEVPIYSGPENRSGELGQIDVTTVLFGGDAMIPDLVLLIEFTNRSAMFHSAQLNNYASAGLLTLISIILILYLIKAFLQQKRTLQVQKDFVHGMTHEFNTPLSNIKLVAQQLVKSDNEQIRKVASILNEEGDKLQAGINLVLTTALIERDELLLEREETDINILLERVLSENKKMLDEADVEVETNWAELESVEADIFHLGNVFRNLILNVCKHSRARHLKISTWRVKGEVVVQFEDDGKGIPEKERKRIFDKFRSLSDNGEKNGYGLGLYYSRMIVEMHGGSIQLKLKDSPGCIFTLNLPL